ncbi:hypothetical protein CAPTEDRAFT_192165, partial [Capitella teleta]
VGYPSKDRVKVYWRDVADGLLVEPQPDGFASSVETEPGVRYSSAISPQMTSSLESVYVINQSKNTFISLDVNEIHTLHWNILKTVPKNTDLRPYESTVIEYGIEVKNAEFTSEDLHVRAFAYPMMESDEWFVPGKDFSFKTGVECTSVLSPRVGSVQLHLYCALTDSAPFEAFVLQIKGPGVTSSGFTIIHRPEI